MLAVAQEDSKDECLLGGSCKHMTLIGRGGCLFASEHRLLGEVGHCGVAGFLIQAHVVGRGRLEVPDEPGAGSNVSQQLSGSEAS